MTNQNTILALSDKAGISSLLPKKYAHHLLGGEVGRFESHADANVINLDYYDTQSTDAPPRQILMYHTQEKLLFICEDQAVAQVVRENLTDADTADRQMYEFFANLIEGDTAYLELMEERIISLENHVLTKSPADCTQAIVTFRRQLFVQKKFYEQLNSIFEGLVENENGLISPDCHRYFEILDNRIDRLFENVRGLMDYVTQVREAYQAQIDIQQNNLMKVFTVVTAVFLPLTLLVGWYGMNLQMPEYNWEHAYPVLIVISVIIVAVCLIVFKKKKLF